MIDRSIRNSTLMVFALLFAFGSLTGCVTRQADTRIALLDRLGSELKYGEPRTIRSVSGEGGAEVAPLSVTVPLRNVRRSGDLILQYRFTFYDANGVPMRPESSPQRVLIPAGGERTARGAALDAGAVDWRLEVQRSRAR
ncbi:MAG: YcfL family protein [Phycisphaeraceae bacterium]|nr:YcfL family protein [Phycisphaeraceae bacterium]